MTLFLAGMTTSIALHQALLGSWFTSLPFAVMAAVFLSEEYMSRRTR